MINNMDKSKWQEKGYADEPIPAGTDLKAEIRRMCKEKNAVIMAHYYTQGEIQDIADFVGDSLALAQKAAQTDADIIVMCGVHFMGETNKILCPDKVVLVPDLNAKCSLAESCPADAFAKFVEEHPDHTVISYVNTTAATKAHTDVVVTSSNARQIVESFPKDEKIIFGPDQNLGGYINSITGRSMLLWNGACHVHEKFSLEKILQLKQDGAGANAIWNITNVTRSDRPKLYTTTAWADKMAETPSVIEAIKNDPLSPYFANGTDEGIADAVRNLLSPATNQFDNPWHCFAAEMSDYNYYAFLVWHRGLSIPRARNLHDAEVQQGKKIFNEIGCATCHRPSWTTGEDNYWAPAIIGNRQLPKYPKQTIYPYTDMIQHKLAMKNDIHGSWCRTTPLWGRGLSLVNTGAEDRLHDCRARNEIEAIMWHGYSKDSHAYKSAEKFFYLKKPDRDAVVKFLRSI